MPSAIQSFRSLPLSATNLVLLLQVPPEEGQQQGAVPRGDQGGRVAQQHCDDLQQADLAAVHLRKKVRQKSEQRAEDQKTGRTCHSTAF